MFERTGLLWEKDISKAKERERGGEPSKGWGNSPSEGGTGHPGNHTKTRAEEGG